MLEIRYDKNTKVVTAWCGDSESFGNLDRGRDNETTMVLDVPLPRKHCLAYLYDNIKKKLVDNPNYVEPSSLRDLAKEIDELKAEFEAWEATK